MVRDVAGASRGTKSSESWVISITDELVKEIKEFANPGLGQKRRSRLTIFRVPKQVKERLEGKDITFYSPEGISLGLFHRPGRYDAPKRGRKFKLKMAAAFLTSVYQREDYRNETLVSLKRDPAVGKQLNPNLERTTSLPVDDTVRPSRNDNTPSLDAVAKQCSVEFLTSGFGEHIWRYFCNLLMGSPVILKVRERYDLHEDDIIKDDELTEVQTALTLDAIIVGCLFWVLSYEDDNIPFPFPLIKDCAKKEKHGRIPPADFLKLENQIPLDLPRKVLHVLSPETGDEDLNRACAFFAKDCVKYLPGYDRAHDLLFINRLREQRKFLDCDHLLDSIALVLRLPPEIDDGSNEEHGQPKSQKAWLVNIKGRMSQATRMLNGKVKLLFGMISCFLRWCFKCGRVCNATPSSTLKEDEFSGFNIPCATLLREAGIELRGCSRGPTSDLLPVFKQGWLKATLYIPRLPILPIVTWTVWRNILAYECERNRHLKKRLRRESQLHAFLAFMCCLVDTKEDVLLFTHGGNPVLPEGYNSTPELLATRFNTILTGLPFADYQRWVTLSNQINNFRKQNCRRLILDSLRANFGKPWLVVSVLAGVIFLALTFIQAIYAILSYKSQSG